MYIAETKHNGKNRFFLRQTIKTDDHLTHQDIFDLGNDPSRQIIYAGGNAFYFNEDMEEALADLKIIYDSDELEDLFWPWIRPDIKRAVDTFKNRSSKKHPPLSEKDKNAIRTEIHPFDKRRTHYLKFGSMDQGPIENMPRILFRNLIHQSRDEIEQYFLRQEFSLKAHELKSYVYTVFDIQSFFSGFLAKEMPHALDQAKVDAYFLKELCRINLHLFGRQTDLHEYMKKYLFMFFDHQYADTRLLDDLANDFMFRQRFNPPKPPINIPVRNALKIFQLNKKMFKGMNKKQLTRHYRRLARKVHPDTGGSHDEFVDLNNAYKSLLSKVSE